MAETPNDTEIIDWMEAQVRAAPDGPRTIHALNVDGRGLPENMTLRESFSLMMQAAKQRDDSVRIPWVEASHPDYGRMQWNTHDIGVSEVTPPAAPSVGEPEPYTDDELALVLAELPNWLEHVETSECPVCHSQSRGFKMSCPPICTSCGWKSKVHPTMIGEAIPEIAVRLSALRSSLEEARQEIAGLDGALALAAETNVKMGRVMGAAIDECNAARKDSERWQWARERFKLVAMPADEFCPRPAAYLDAPDLMEFTMCDGQFETVDAIVDRARAAALARHLPPRAPSPRDEP